MKRVLFISQSTSLFYINLIIQSLDNNVVLDVMTGSDINKKNVSGKIINAPKYDSLSFKSRLMTWMRFFCFALRWLGQNRTEHYDLIYSTSNPPLNSYIGLKFKKEYNCPFIFMYWDLYPQIISATFSNPVVSLIANGWKRWNIHNFKKIDQIVTIGEIMSKSIYNGLNQDLSVKVIPISVDVHKLQPIKKSLNPFVLNNNLSSKFIVLYSGKMGVGHNIECILKASELLKDFHDILFVFIGKGTKYKLVKDYIEKNQSNNVRIYPLQPDDVFPYSMACGDIGIVSQEAKMAHLFMPSKAYSMMACGQAIIGLCSGDDDLSLLIKKNKIGYAVSDSSPVTLANHIRYLYENKDELTSMQLRAREIAVKDYSNKVITEKYRQLFSNYLKF